MFRYPSAGLSVGGLGSGVLSVEAMGSCEGLPGRWDEVFLRGLSVVSSEFVWRRKGYS